MSRIDVLFYPSPVTREVCRVTGVEAGMTVGALAGDIAVTTINGRRASADDVICDGDLVVVRARPRLEVGAWLASMAITALGWTGTTAIIASHVITYGTALALSMGLSYAAAKLVAPQIPSAPGPGEPFNRRASLTKASNQANFFGPVPRLYGTRRFFPVFAANPYTEIVGDDQYLCLLFCLGYGPLQINGMVAGGGKLITNVGYTVPVHTSPNLIKLQIVASQLGDAVKIGDSPAWQYDGVEIEIGVIDDITLFTRDVEEEALSIAFDLVHDYTTTRELQLAWHVDNVSATRTTAPNADWVSIDIVFPNGFFTADELNQTNTVVGVNAATTEWRIEQRLVGTTEWADVINPWTVYGTKRETLRVTHRWAVVRGQYEVRLTRMRTFLSNHDVVSADALWTAIRTIHRTSPWAVRYDQTGQEIVMMAMRVKASDQLQGTLNNVSVLATAMVPTFNGTNWTAPVATNSPAWAYADVLRGRQLKRPVSDSRINGAKLLEWAAWCSSNGIEYNWVHASDETVVDRLRAIASCGRASWSLLDGKFSVVHDVAQEDPVQMFSPRNSHGYSGEFAFPDIPHGLRVRYDDPVSWETVERVVYADGYNALNATRLEVLETQGVTSAEQAWKEGRYHLAQQQLRPEIHKINTDFEAIVATRGDMVLLANDAITVGLKWGRVKRVIDTTVIGGVEHATRLSLDEKVTMETGRYGVRIRRANNTYAISEVPLLIGESDAVTLLTPLSGVAAGDLFLFGVFGTESIECKVLEVNYGHDLSAEVTLVPHAPQIDDSDTGPLPPFDPGINKPIDLTKVAPTAPRIDAIRSGSAQLLRAPDGSIRASVAVSFALAAGVPCAFVQARWRVHGNDEPYRVVQDDASAPAITLLGMDDGAEIDIQLRVESVYGVWSEWTGVNAHTVVGKLEVPPDVAEFLVVRQQDGTRVFTWHMPFVPLDIEGYAIRYSLNLAATWEQMTPLHDGLLLASPYETNQLAAGVYVVGIKAYDIIGEESANATIIQSTLGDPRLGNVIYREEVRTFPGTKTGCWYDAVNNVLVPNGTDTWDTLPSTWDAWTGWNMNPVASMVYEQPVIDLDASINFTVSCEVIMSGGSWAAEEAHSDDGANYSAWAAIGQPVKARYIKVRFIFTSPTPAGVQFAAINLTGNVIIDEITDLDTSTISNTGGGDFRVPLTKTYAVITSVTMALQNVGAGWTWEVVDKNVVTGPRIRIYDNTGTLADATVDIIVRGL